jgi:hypothetical protein
MMMLSFLAAVIVAIVLEVWRRHALVPQVPAEVWPWLLGEVRVHVSRHGAPLPAVLLAVGLHGPDPLSAASTAALDEWRASGDVQRTLTTLRECLSDADADRVCEAVLTASLYDIDADRLLSDLQQIALERVLQSRELRRVAASGAAARWLLVAPLALVFSGHADAGTGVLAALVAGAGWSLSGVALRTPRPPRVFCRSS